MKDEMSIRTDFGKGFIGALISKAIKRSSGIDTTIDFNNLSIFSSDDDGKIRVNANVSFSCNREDLYKLLK